MSRKPLIAGNWKMNLNHFEAIALVQKIAFSLPDKYFDKVDVAVLPPFTDLRSVQTLVDGDKLRLTYGAQDLSQHESGAYTGDISGAFLAKLGCTYVVVGHSERRTYHNEDDSLVTVRRIVRAADVRPDDVVVEVGPGLGSLTLALLPAVKRVVAIEIDPILAAALPSTVEEFAPSVADRLEVVTADALQVTSLPGADPTALVANLPYNVAVPVLLHLLETFPTLQRVLVMVQKEVADRLTAGPGSRTYGVPSVKAAWYGRVRPVGTVSRTVFWPAPNVDSGLVALEKHDPPPGADREAVFTVIDAAFAQRRKTLRAALSGWAGSPAAAEDVLRAAGVDPQARGEQLTVEDFARIAAARR